MKEYKDESGNTVKEYSFEDWEQGYIDGTIAYGTKRIRCTHENGEVTEYIRVLPKAEYDKIQIACEKQFNKRVNQEVETLKGSFYKGVDQSLNRSEYIEYEIQRVEYILFKSTREKYTKPDKLNLEAYPNYPQLYERYVINGDKVYDFEHRMKVLIAANTNLLIHSARVIALKRHLEWLFDLRKNPREAYQNRKYFWELIDEKLKKIQASHKWQSISREIDEKGYMGFRWEKILTKVYTPELMYILSNKNIELWNNEKGKEEAVNNQPFRIAYADGFLAGEKYFEQKWQIDKAILSSPSAPSFIKSLLENYFKSGVKKKLDVKGWNYVKRQFPLVLSEAIIYDFGKHSGIVSKADEIFLEYAPYFEPYWEKQAPAPKKVETLSSLITHHENDAIVEAVKIKYKNIKGKRLKLLLLAFQQLGLLPSERIANKFHECCKREFDWDIATYTAMNDYSYNTETDAEILNGMKEFLQSLIETK